MRRARRCGAAAGLTGSPRREIEPAERRAYATFLPAWHGVDRHAAAGAGVERLREQLVPLQGLALTPRTWEREVLPCRVGAYSTTWMDELCASGELVWVGAGALGRNDGRVALYFREDVALLGPPPASRGASAPPRGAPERPWGASQATRRARACTRASETWRVFLHGSALRRGAVRAGARGGAVGPGVGGGGDQRRVRSAARAASDARDQRLGHLTAGSRHTLPPTSLTSVVGDPPVGFGARPPGRRGRFSMVGGPRARRAGGRGATYLPGRWSLTAPLFAGASSPSEHARATAELLLERHGILTRELVLAEGVPGGFAALYPELCRLETLGIARRGYFVEGLGGAQFALPGAVERLRAQRLSELERSRPLVLAATDPAQPYGAALPWRGSPGSRRQELAAAEPQRPAAADGARSCRPSRPSPPRVAGASVVLVGGEPVLYLERGGRGLRVLADPDDDCVQQALEALAEHARAGRLPVRIALERVDGEPVLGSRWETALERAGFRVGPRRVELGSG